MQSHKLYEQSPAEDFSDAHLLGNGRLGASVYGGIPDNRIVLNDDTFWSGSESRHENPESLKNLPVARDLIMRGKYAEATDLIESKMLGTWTQSYLPIGELNISMSSGTPGTNDHYWRREGLDYSGYSRRLDIGNAVETIEYEFRGCRFTQECFVSHPAQILVVRLSADSACLNFNLSFESAIRHVVSILNGELRITGRAPDHVEPVYSPQKPAVMYLPDEESESIRFGTIVRILATDGTVLPREHLITVSEASSVVVGVAVHTNYDGYERPRDKDTGRIVRRCADELDSAGAQGYAGLKAEHIEDYTALYSRVDVDIAPGVLEDLPTTDRAALHVGGLEDPSLLATAIQYARYLLISSSRPGTQAANLQGIWNPLVRAPWSSNYTTNINVQMNYWPAEVLNLSECHGPMIDFVDEISRNGTWTAENYFRLDGWTCNHNVDLWRSTIPVCGRANWAYWPVAGGWLCQHLWQHYEFTNDQDYLRERAYPVMLEAARFLLGYLVEDDEEYLSTAPSISPENNFFLEKLADIDSDVLKTISALNRQEKQRVTSPVCKSSAMDMTIIRELFRNCLGAESILETKSDISKRMDDALGRLYPLKIGKHGQLQEWNEDFDECTPGMGHVSHMYGLHPGDLMTFDNEPELYEACRISLLRRRAHGGLTGHWPGAWAMSLFARLKDPVTCGTISKSVFQGLGANMMTREHTQIDCVFGIGAGATEMLLQSHAGCMELLPSVPHSWRSGSFRGFRARGGFEVDASWSDGKLIQAKIVSHNGGICRLRTGREVAVTSDGSPMDIDSSRDGEISWATDANAEYGVSFIR